VETEEKNFSVFLFSLSNQSTSVCTIEWTHIPVCVCVCLDIYACACARVCVFVHVNYYVREF